MGQNGDKTASRIDFLKGASDLASYFSFIRIEGITADQLLGVAFEPDTDIIRTVFASHRLDESAQGMLAYESSPEVISCIPISYITLLETTTSVQMHRKFVLRLTTILTQIRDRSGKPENPIYCAGQTKELPCQYALLGSKRLVVIHEPGSPGISSIRYDAPRHRFIGIRADSRGLGVALACIDEEPGLKHPDKLSEPGRWHDVIQTDGLPFLALSRPFALHKGGQFVVNHADDRRDLVGFDGQGNAIIHRTFAQTTRIIGASAIHRPRTVITYLPKPNGTQVQVIKVPQSGPSPLSQVLL